MKNQFKVGEAEAGTARPASLSTFHPAASFASSHLAAKVNRRLKRISRNVFIMRVSNWPATLLSRLAVPRDSDASIPIDLQTEMHGSGKVREISLGLQVADYGGPVSLIDRGGHIEALRVQNHTNRASTDSCRRLDGEAPESLVGCSDRANNIQREFQKTAIDTNCWPASFCETC